MEFNPRGCAVQKRDNRKTMRFTDEEMARARGRAAALDIDFSECIRECAFGFMDMEDTLNSRAASAPASRRQTRAPRVRQESAVSDVPAQAAGISTPFAGARRRGVSDGLQPYADLTGRKRQ